MMNLYSIGLPVHRPEYARAGQASRERMRVCVVIPCLRAFLIYCAHKKLWRDTLDPFLRGFNENLMDTNLSETEVKNLKGITAIFGKEIKSKLDAQFGFILGYSYAKFNMQFLILKNRLPTKEETKAFFEIIKRRHSEIVSILKDVKIADIAERYEAISSFQENEVEPVIDE